MEKDFMAETPSIEGTITHGCYYTSCDTEVNPAVRWKATSSWNDFTSDVVKSYDYSKITDLGFTTEDLGKSLERNREVEKMAKDKEIRRLVQVFIVDPDKNVPLEEAVLYEGKRKLTDLDDRELFFEIDITSLLKRYNEKRITYQDKEASKGTEKNIYLEKIRIRDLGMIVNTILTF